MMSSEVPQFFFSQGKEKDGGLTWNEGISVILKVVTCNRCVI